MWKKLGTWCISVITYDHQLLCKPVIKTKKRSFLCIPNSMKKSSFCSTGPMLIVAAFCIALNVTLQEVGEHDLVGLRFGGFKVWKSWGDLVFMVATKGTRMNLSKKCPGEVEQLFLLQHSSIFQWRMRSSYWNIFCKVSIAKSDLSAWRREIISCHFFSMQRRELSASNPNPLAPVVAKGMSLWRH